MSFVLSIVLLLLLALIGSGFYFVTHMGSGLIATITNSVPAGTTSRQTVGSQVTPQALFADDFANNDNNWDTTSGSGYTRDISNNVLTLADANHKILIETLSILPPRLCPPSPASYREIDPETWMGREQEGILYVPHAGEILYRARGI